jgi:hypothetical protein
MLKRKMAFIGTKPENFGVVIRVLILRENGDAWTRIGIGEYSGKDSTTNEYGVGAVEKAYLKSLKRFEKSTIRLT